MPRVLTGVLLVALLAPTTWSAETARELLDRRRRLDDTTWNWRDREQTVELAIAGKGFTLHRTLVIYERRLPGDEEQTIVFVTAPASLRSMGFLSFSHPNRADDQWVSMPAIKRVRRIESGAEAKQDKFMGTDLTYHELDLLQDVTRWSEAAAPSALLGQVVVDGEPTFHIERRPTQDGVEYPRIQLWLRTQDLVTCRVAFFENGAEPVRTVTQAEVRLTQGIPVAHRIDVTTPAVGTRSTLTVRQVRFDQQLEAALFTQRALEHGKR